jgi:hypothetical protein
MAFYHRYRSPRMSAVLRSPETGNLVGREIEVEIDLVSDVIDARGLLVPEEALGRLDGAMRDLFDGKLLIDNQDPHADDLMKLKRIRAADPVLFDNGTSGPQLSFYVGRHVEDWLSREKWNAPQDDPQNVKIALATVRLGRSEFFYDLT